MKISVERVGPMAFNATSESGHQVLMDASKAVGGDDRGPRPMEMLLMGLGGCTSIDVVMILEKARQQVDNCKVEISANRAEQNPRIFTDIHVHFIVYGKSLSEERVARAIQLSADKYCSASIMLAKAAEITHDFEIVET